MNNYLVGAAIKSMSQMTNSNEIFQRKVSYQVDTWSKFSEEKSIKETLDSIKGDIFKNRILRLRKYLDESDTEAFSAEKLRLPAVTFSGTFNNVRKKDDLKEYNSVVVIDIDKLNEDQLSKACQILSEDEYIMAYWISPSNRGLKGLVSIHYEFDIGDDISECHKTAFVKLWQYFSSTYSLDLDKSGSDITRLCFLSWDPKLFFNHQSNNFIVKASDLVITNEIATEKTQKSKAPLLKGKSSFFNSSNRNNPFQKREIKDIINFLTKRKIVVTGEYEDRYRICYALANSFTYDLGVKFYIALCKIESGKFNEEKEIKLLQYCYSNNSGMTKFSFIIELARKFGFQKKILERVVS